MLACATGKTCRPLETGEPTVLDGFDCLSHHKGNAPLHATARPNGIDGTLNADYVNGKGGSSQAPSQRPAQGFEAHHSTSYADELRELRCRIALVSL